MVPAFAANQRPVVLRAPKKNQAQEALNTMSAGAGHALRQAGRVGDALVEGAVRGLPHAVEGAGLAASGIGGAIQAVGPSAGRALGRASEAAAAIAERAAPAVGNLLAGAAQLGSQLTEAQNMAVAALIQQALSMASPEAPVEAPALPPPPPRGRRRLRASSLSPAAPVAALPAPPTLPALMDAPPAPERSYEPALTSLDGWETRLPRGSQSNFRSRQRLARLMNDSGTSQALLGYNINLASHETLEAGLRALDTHRRR